MRPKYKVTGCARFFFFFIIFIPIVYFGAAYIRGEDGVQKIKDFYHEIVGKSSSSPSGQHEYNPDERVKKLEKELESANEKIQELEDQLKAKEAEIRDLKK